ncbi:hypothetical protein SLEP1_g18332 [Rubroshorea leprosula]|uniref:Uncharacterized protein n=1 Tax=Rubroshorea leprosula TaxID=152421 RepID=A0AAV5J7P6_9ROSI|nr:hypothetical protein SLEP1_g18332 [Rubroshorea leprosula]
MVAILGTTAMGINWPANDNIKPNMEEEAICDGGEVVMIGDTGGAVVEADWIEGNIIGVGLPYFLGVEGKSYGF